MFIMNFQKYKRKEGNQYESNAMKKSTKISEIPLFYAEKCFDLALNSSSLKVNHETISTSLRRIHSYEYVSKIHYTKYIEYHRNVE